MTLPKSKCHTISIVHSIKIRKKSNTDKTTLLKNPLEIVLLISKSTSPIIL